MFSPIYCVLLWFLPVLYYSGSTATDFQPYLTLYPPGDLEYTDVLVRRVGDNLTLACELKGDAAPRIYVWNFVPSDNTSGVDVSLSTDPRGPALGSRLSKRNLTISDSGHYVCSAPPYSVTKFVLVQTRGPVQCARSAFWCGAHCVLPSYVCDGYRDCRGGEDEAPQLCMRHPCAGADKLNCSSGRCISSAACCRRRDALCKQPTCCDEHHMYSVMEGFVEPEYPPLFEDRRAPDEYGFIQSTIYTVTACALIFMIAVVLLVSAICKMHMKRAALRNYTHATTHHYDQRFAQTHRFPPCYEASRLLEQERAHHSPSNSPVRSAHSSPAHAAGQQCNPEFTTSGGGGGGSDGNGPGSRGFPLAALSAVFTQRYRQIPTQCLDVEMTDVRHNSCNTSPQHNQNSTTLDNYRSPTFCDLNSDLFFNQDSLNCGRELNYMGGLECLSRRPSRNSVGRARPLTLQLGRFQLSIPRLGRRQSLDRRPDTPNVAELNIDDLDFVRLNSNDTYTLNGRTIRLLGANFENYPVLDESSRPPPYNDAMRYKLYGPPPEYLSRDRLNERDNNNTEERARTNVEMPPCYDELASGVAATTDNVAATTDNVEVAIANSTNNNVASATVGNVATDNVAVVAATQQNDNDSDNNNAVERNDNSNSVVDNSIVHATDAQNNFDATTRGCDVSFENLSSVIDNLPAIDSDVNANERDVTSYATSAVS